MDGQQYLQQISESTRPASKASQKSGVSGILSSKIFVIGAIGLGLLIVIIIIGAILGSNKGGEYQQYVKSSGLRSNSASLNGVLTNTSRDLTSYLEAKYDFKDKDISDAMEEEATLAKDELSNELFEAKINGILDRIYAHKMAYEISLFTAEEAQLMKESKDEALTELLNTSYESLNNLYDKFNDFSETKN